MSVKREHFLNSSRRQTRGNSVTDLANNPFLKLGRAELPHAANVALFQWTLILSILMLYSFVEPPWENSPTPIPSVTSEGLL